MYNKAVKYQPNLKKELAKTCFNKGTSINDSITRNKHSGNSEAINIFSNLANPLFSCAIKFDPTLVEKAHIEKRKYGRAMLEKAKNNWKNNKSRRNSKPYKEAQKYLTKLEIEKVIPPPSWKSRPGFPKTFTGKGYKRSDAIIVATNGIDTFYGDKVIAIGPGLAEGRVSKKKATKYIYIRQSKEKGLKVRYRSAPGVKFKVDIKYYD